MTISPEAEKFPIIPAPAALSFNRRWKGFQLFCLAHYGGSDNFLERFGDLRFVIDPDGGSHLDRGDRCCRFLIRPLAPGRDTCSTPIIVPVIVIEL
jgi:hypothetical protein